MISVRPSPCPSRGLEDLHRLRGPDHAREAVDIAVLEATGRPLVAARFGISRNHPFLDGNKRTSLVVAELFLMLNCVELTATNTDCVTTFLRLAAGEITEEELADWIAANSSPVR